METHWDKIYQDHESHQKYTKGYGTLGTGLLADFERFIESSAFSVKSALDICCGPGNYLKYLENLGFTVSGIDSSSTAIALCKKDLSAKANVAVADMYSYEITRNKFDLIFSISAIHHGRKEEVNNLISRIISATLPDGKIFITLPIYPQKGLIHRLYKGVKKLLNRIISATLPDGKIFRPLSTDAGTEDWEKDTGWRYIGDGVVVGLSGPEKGLPHSLYKKKEVDKLFSNCRATTIKRTGATWIITTTR
jgi:SAM-dependent methyltransferase